MKNNFAAAEYRKLASNTAILMQLHPTTKARATGARSMKPARSIRPSPPPMCSAW